MGLFNENYEEICQNQLFRSRFFFLGQSSLLGLCVKRFVAASCCSLFNTWLCMSESRLFCRFCLF